MSILEADSLNFLSAFLGGFVMSFTPCVFPLIPVTTGYIGISASGSRLKGFILGFVYVTGVALTYAALGVAASLTGNLFGKVSSNPWVLMTVGAVIGVFGLAMLDLFHISLPQAIKMPVHKKGSVFSTFVLGLCSGFVVAPCTAPVMGSILVLISTRSNVVYGGLLLLCFAYGMGFILIASAVFSALLTTLPKAGRWMVIVKKIYALLLLGASAYFIAEAVRRIFI